MPAGFVKIPPTGPGAGAIAWENEVSREAGFIGVGFGIGIGIDGSFLRHFNPVNDDPFAGGGESLPGKPFRMRFPSLPGDAGLTTRGRCATVSPRRIREAAPPEHNGPSRQPETACALFRIRQGTAPTGAGVRSLSTDSAGFCKDIPKVTFIKTVDTNLRLEKYNIC